MEIARAKKTDPIKKIFSWLILIDFGLLIMFMIQMTSLTLISGTAISFLLVMYNGILTFFCFKRVNGASDSYILYPIITATLIVFISLLCFFLLVN